jgi:chromosome segregation ATPase
MTMTCGNDHTIGYDGVHLRLVGMDTFAELSLVGRGAAKDAKILSRAKNSQSLSQETVERLAASKLPAEAHVFTASFKMDNTNSNPSNQGDQQMSSTLEATLAQTSKDLGKVEFELNQATKTIEDLTGQIATLQESVTVKDAEIADLKAGQDTEMTTLQATNEELNAKLSEASEVVLGDLKAAMIATGEKEEDIPEDLSAMLSSIKEKGLKLHQLFGAGGTSEDVKADRQKDEDADRRKLNFKVT